jgi:hypothetical protein
MGENGVSFIHEDSIKHQGKYAGFTIVVDKKSRENITYSVQDYIMDCETGDWKIIRIENQFVDKQYQEISGRVLESAPFQKNIPNTESSVYFRYVCNRKQAFKL